MGTGKKERNRAISGSASAGGGASSKAANNHSLTNVTRVKGTNFYRDAKKVKQVNMLKGGKPTRNADGKIIKAAVFQNRLPSGTMARVAPNRRWFENTRVVGQKELEAFREAMGAKADDPYTVLLHQNKLPMSLLVDSQKVSRMHLLETDPFGNTFGPKAQRKKPKLSFSSAEDLAAAVNSKHESYTAAKDSRLIANMSQDGVTDESRDPIFSKGQSKRIWGELYKVIDSSDVIIHVLDARDPIGTRCKSVENYIRKEAPHKHLIYVLNKCDLVPTWATAKWVRALSREYPTLAFHASITNSFGKGSLIQLLRQFSNLHSDKKQISVGFIGYPNTGKSSIINTLRNKKTCNVAPIPGETKVWQYITLMKRIYLIDCPGIVPPSQDDTETDTVLKGVVRIENISQPDDYVLPLLERVKPEYMRRTYNVDVWDDHVDFLTQVCKRTGKLLKGGEPDLTTVAKMILNDWLRGKIPYYTTPPEVDEGAEDKNEGVDQAFSKIPVSTKFMDEDLKNNELLPAESAAALKVDEEFNDEEDNDEEKPSTSSKNQMWDEVFGAAGDDEDRKGADSNELAEPVKLAKETVKKAKDSSTTESAAVKTTFRPNVETKLSLELTAATENVVKAKVAKATPAKSKALAKMTSQDKAKVSELQNYKLPADETSAKSLKFSQGPMEKVLPRKRKASADLTSSKEEPTAERVVAPKKKVRGLPSFKVAPKK
ncbi:GTPase required for pre-60S ribosomal subunit nuclear export and maturation [Phlyctochytrium planicorne]|nr:GTPase required for pre-60S ribosomal subunit nuclear export and maturation [Phlyctochytrium planicorne]